MVTSSRCSTPFDAVSLQTRSALSTPTVSSLDAGWNSMLVERRTVPAGDAEFETRPTSDTCVVLRLSGVRRIESLRGGSWRGAVYGPGSLGVTAGGEDNRLRYSCRTPWQVGHFFVPAQIVGEAAELLRPAGVRASGRRLHALHLDDPLLATTCERLLAAAAKRLPDLYAEQAAHWLAVHTLTLHGGDYGRSPRSPGKLTDVRLSRTVDLIRQCFAEQLTLDRLAAEAGISKFHFTRLFRQHTGCTPVAYVERVRLSEAARLLRSTDLSVAEVARRVGFAGPDQFTASFKRTHKMPPRSYRRAGNVGTAGLGSGHSVADHR